MTFRKKKKLSHWNHIQTFRTNTIISHHQARTINSKIMHRCQCPRQNSSTFNHPFPEVNHLADARETI